MRLEYKLKSGDFIYKYLESNIEILHITTDTVKLNDLYRMSYSLNKYLNDNFYHKAIDDRMIKSISIDKINKSLRSIDNYIFYIPKVGFLDITLKSKSGKKYMHLKDIYINDNMRYKGIAQKLINYAKYFALLHGKKILTYDCHEDNVSSQCLAKKLGFKDTN